MSSDGLKKLVAAVGSLIFKVQEHLFLAGLHLRLIENEQDLADKGILWKCLVNLHNVWLGRGFD